jgi:hypothetical protein
MKKKLNPKLKKALLLIGVVITLLALKALITPSYIIPIVLLGLLPVMLFALKFVIVTFVKKQIRKYQGMINKLEKQKIKQIDKNQGNVWESENKKFYKYTQHLFHDLMQQGRITRQQILEFNKLIDSYLGTYAKQYKHMSFANNAHMIYVKLHCYHLTPFCYIQLIEFLEEITSNTNNANNLNYKGEDNNVSIEPI